MKLEEAKKFLKKKITVNNAVIKEARKNGDLNTMELTNDLDTESKAIETVLQALETYQNIIHDKDQEIIELNQKCILEKVAKEEVEELLENSISKDKVKEIFEIKIYNRSYLAFTDWTEHQKEVDLEVARILKIIEQQILEDK